MLKIDFTEEVVFSFEGPNLCLLGNKNDFLMLAQAIKDLTSVEDFAVEIQNLNFVANVGQAKKILFMSKPNGKSLGLFDCSAALVFELDLRYWERLFKYFVFMSWDQCTFYLNANEDCLIDLELNQECNFICSSEF